MDNTNTMGIEEFNNTPVEGVSSSTPSIVPEQAVYKQMTADDLKEIYKNSGKSVFCVSNIVRVDDDTEVEFSFLFEKPKTASYDRYIKTISTSATTASKMFAMDNVVPEQKKILKEALEEYPAMSMSISEKLLKMLGLADSTAIKKL